MMLWLLPKLLGIGEWLKQAARYLLAHPMTAVALLCAIVAAVEHHEAGKWAKVAEQRGNALNAAQDASKAELARAQAEYDAAAQREKELNDATDRKVAELRADSTRRVADYIRLHPARREGDGGALPAASQANVAQSSDGPGADTALVEVPAWGLKACQTIRDRLVAIHDEAVAK